MNWIKRNDLGVFLFLAFALSWWVWPFHWLNPNSTPMLPWGPLFAVFIVLGLTRGRAGLKSLLADMFRWKVGGRWYATVFLLPSVLTVIAMYLNVALGGPAPAASLFTASELLILIPAFLSTTLVAGPFTEEPAWRGYLLPRLQEKYSPLAASLIVGLIWWVWHLPLMISDVTGQRPPLPYLASILAYSLLYTWIYNHAQASVFILTLLHGATNTIAAFLFRGLFGEHYLQLWWLYAGLWWVVALWVLRRSKMPAAAGREVVRPQL